MVRVIGSYASEPPRQNVAGESVLANLPPLAVIGARATPCRRVNVVGAGELGAGANDIAVMPVAVTPNPDWPAAVRDGELNSQDVLRSINATSELGTSRFQPVQLPLHDPRYTLYVHKVLLCGPGLGVLPAPPRPFLCLHVFYKIGCCASTYYEIKCR